MTSGMSPENSTPSALQYKQIESLVCPGVWMEHREPPIAETHLVAIRDQGAHPVQTLRVDQD